MFLSEKYREIVEPRLRRFVRNGDDVMCVGVFKQEGQQCKVCDYMPITWNYIIENLATNDHLIAGSECICNYEVILKEWGYRPEYIVYPTYFLQYAKWITEGNEHHEGNTRAIRFHDKFLKRVTVDAREVVKGFAASADLLAYVPVKNTMQHCARCGETNPHEDFDWCYKCETILCPDCISTFACFPEPMTTGWAVWKG